MRWQGRRGSTDVIDKRGLSAGGGIALGGTGLLIVLALSLLFGQNPLDVLSQLQGGGGGFGTQQMQEYQPTPEEQQLAEFASVVLADTEQVWGELFPQQLGRAYEQPRMVLFSGQVDSACGYASAAVGPFYCPSDANVYLDLSFFNQLEQQFGAAGDFAQAYVIAHEVGHHIQRQLGITQKMDSMRGRVSQDKFNEMSVRLELQADFLAGIWAHYAEKRLKVIEPGDISEALGAASAIGDDRLQQEHQGYVVPDSFTHGTSEQRMRWFRRGYETGDVSQGDTFAAKQL
jgi:predicted metalloprotease